MMTQRERYLGVMLYGQYDRIPFDPGGARKSTRETWYRQGLPENADYHTCLLQELGLDQSVRTGLASLPVDSRMIPQFEEKVLEERERSLVVQDWKGNICEISRDFDVTYLRQAIDFVTRTWIKCPVETREDWEQMKERYDLDSPGRFPADFAEIARKHRDRDYPLELTFSGPFWQLREWLGFEGLCMRFIDDPALVSDMIAFWDRFMSELLRKTFAQVVPDAIHINEDMAYKLHPMISPAMARQYLAPSWKHWSDIAVEAGVPLRGVDSDGYIHDLLPIWIDCGINWCDPIEVAAGNDLNRMRQDCGTRLAFKGGVDKRAMAAGGAVVEAEMERLDPVVRGGGYIPSCDHGVPPDISWPDFIHYSRILAKKTGWLR